MDCPEAKKQNCKRKLEPLLEGSSWVCVKAECNHYEDLEFYKVKDMGLMTREEFFSRRKAEGEV